MLGSSPTPARYRLSREAQGVAGTHEDFAGWVPEKTGKETGHAARKGEFLLLEEVDNGPHLAGPVDTRGESMTRIVGKSHDGDCPICTAAVP